MGSVVESVVSPWLIEPKVVIPCHYDTWPPIEQDTGVFADSVGDLARVEVLQPGGRYAL